MGRDKAFLELHGRTLLDHTLALARSITSDVHLVGDPNRLPSFEKVIADRYPGSGPLAGIHAALLASATDLNLVVAVDTPFLPARLLRFLVAEAERTGAIVTVPRIEGRFHPLCAVYRKEFASFADRSLATGRNKIDPLFEQVNTRIVTEADLKPLDIQPYMFDNLNTPEDLLRAQSANAHE